MKAYFTSCVFFLSKEQPTGKPIKQTAEEVHVLLTKMSKEIRYRQTSELPLWLWKF